MTQNKTTAIVKPSDYVRERTNQIIKVLPPAVQERFIQAAVGVSLMPKLANCTPESVFRCVYTAARLNLNPDPAMHLCAVIPFYNNKAKVTEATLVIEYRGLINLARNACPALYVDAGTVYGNDTFALSQGTESLLKITEPWWLENEDPGIPLFSYCISKTPSQPILQLTIISKQEGVKVAKRSKQGYKVGTIWYEHEDRMREKTAVRRASRFWSLDPSSSQAGKFREALEVDEEFDLTSTNDTPLVDGDIKLEEGKHSTKKEPEPKKEPAKEEKKAPSGPDNEPRDTFFTG